VLAILASGAAAEEAAAVDVVVCAGCVELAGPDGGVVVAGPVTSIAVGTVVGTAAAAAVAAAAG